MKFDNEVELGEAVVKHFRDIGWKVYPELNNIDIIACKEKELIGIECKLHFNLKVLHQAWRNRHSVDQTWIAVPKCWTDLNNFSCLIAKQMGIGVLYVSKKLDWQTNNFEYEVETRVETTTSPRTIHYIDDLICPMAENFAQAGKKGGGQWTRFKITSHALVEYVKANPGCTIKEAVASIKHHYRKTDYAKASLMKNIRDGIIKGVLIKDKKLYLINSNNPCSTSN